MIRTDNQQDIFTIDYGYWWLLYILDGFNVNVLFFVDGQSHRWLSGYWLGKNLTDLDLDDFQISTPQNPGLKITIETGWV